MSILTGYAEGLIRLNRAFPWVLVAAEAEASRDGDWRRYASTHVEARFWRTRQGNCIGCCRAKGKEEGSKTSVGADGKERVCGGVLELSEGLVLLQAL